MLEPVIREDMSLGWSRVSFPFWHQPIIFGIRFDRGSSHGGSNSSHRGHGCGHGSGAFVERRGGKEKLSARMEVVEVGGTGCPAGTTRQSVKSPCGEDGVQHTFTW